MYKIIVHPDSIIADLVCMLLSNVTSQEKSCHVLLQLGDSQLQAIRLPKIVDLLATGRKSNPKADFHYLALVLANVSRVRLLLNEFKKKKK